MADPPPKLLSEYGLFVNTKDQITVPGVLPYELITSLFSDYADKHRFVYVPKGKIAAYQKNSVFSFPVGSVLIKTFSYEPINNQTSRRHLIETRLLIRKDSGWDALTYVWDEEGQEASLVLAGKTVKANYISNDGRELDIRYRVPNKNQCKECHLENESIVPIGPKPRNLNRDYTYLEGTINQLEKWLSGQVPYDYPDILRKHVEAKQIELLFDAFRQILPFGTGGRRGRVGYGANRINPTTVAMTVQGHCQFLRDLFPCRQDMVVVVANDVRVFNDFAGIYQFIGENLSLIHI